MVLNDAYAAARRGRQQTEVRAPFSKSYKFLIHILLTRNKEN